MSNNDMMGNWMAAMGMMGTMMAQFQQQVAKNSTKPAPVHQHQVVHQHPIVHQHPMVHQQPVVHQHPMVHQHPVQLGANYGYGGGSHAPVISANYGYGGSSQPTPAASAAPPPPPPPPPEDVPMPPEYSYPRFLEPTFNHQRQTADTSNSWRRKSDADLTPKAPPPEPKKSNISAAQKALITAAERAAKITGKLTGTKTKPAFDESNVPDIKSLQNRALTNLAITAGPRTFSPSGSIQNVSFKEQKGSFLVQL